MTDRRRETAVRFAVAWALMASVTGAGCCAGRSAPGGVRQSDNASAPPDTRPASAAPGPLKVEPLSELSMVGRLGLALGTVTDIRATVMAGRDLQDKAHQSAYLLRVTHVGGRELGEPIDMEFSTRYDVPLANDVFALYQLKHGTAVGTLESAQIRDLERGYVGRNVHLTVYETGEFTGLPRNLPSDLVPWQDTGFGFYTSLIVLAERP